MKKILLSLAALMLVVGCSGATAKDKKEKATYLESVDEYGTYLAHKLVDKDSGCKYLIIKNEYDGVTSITQMLGEDGMPICK